MRQRRGAIPDRSRLRSTRLILILIGACLFLAGMAGGVVWMVASDLYDKGMMDE